MSSGSLKLVEALIEAMQAYKPSDKDPSARSQWNSVLEAGLVTIAKYVGPRQHPSPRQVRSLTASSSQGQY